jgi:hypothetical protein
MQLVLMPLLLKARTQTNKHISCLFCVSPMPGNLGTDAVGAEGVACADGVVGSD